MGAPWAEGGVQSCDLLEGRGADTNGSPPPRGTQPRGLGGSELSLARFGTFCPQGPQPLGCPQGPHRPLRVSSPQSSRPGWEVGDKGSAIIRGQLGDGWAAVRSCLPKFLENGFASIICVGIPPTSNSGGGPQTIAVTIRIAALTCRLTVCLELG